MKYLLIILLILPCNIITPMDRPAPPPEYIIHIFNLMKTGKYFAAYKYVEDLNPYTTNLSVPLASGNTLLHHFVTYKVTHAYKFEENFIQLMLARRANIEACNNEGYTPFMKALDRSNFRAARILAQNGANTKKVFPGDKKTPLHLLCSNNDYLSGLETALCCQQAEHPNLQLLKKILLPASPLSLRELILKQYAFQFLNPMIFNRFPAELKVDILYAYLQQVLLFDLTRLPNKREILEQFYLKIIEESDLDSKSKINQKDAEGNTPLHLLAKHTHPNVANFLVCNGANRLIKNNYDIAPAGQRLDLSLYPSCRPLYEYLSQPQKVLETIHEMIQKLNQEKNESKHSDSCVQ